MATLLISAAVSVAAGVALNALFPPPEIVTEGPRLQDREISTSTYGAFVNIPFGTDRLQGNIIWGLPIIEEKNEDSQEAGKGGGQKSTTISYSYFGTFDISFAISGADDVLRVWADGKLIFDKTGTGNQAKEGVNFAFYGGGKNQDPDPTEVASLGEANTPAYRHLSRLVFTKLPLADYGNRIPNITAEITWNVGVATPFIPLNLPAGFDVPGSFAGTADTHMHIDTTLNSYFSPKNTTDGAWRADRTTGEIQASLVGNEGIMKPGYGHGIFLTGDGGANNISPKKFDAVTGEFLAQSSQTVQNGTSFWQIHRVGNVVTGFKRIGVLAGGNTSEVVVMDAETMGVIRTFTVAGSILPSDENVAIPDDERGFNSGDCYIVAADGADQRVLALEFELNVGTGPGKEGEPVVNVSVELVDRGIFTYSTGANLTRGWAVDGITGDLLLSNSSEIVRYDPDGQSVLKSSTALTGFEGWNNYIKGTIFAYIRSEISLEGFAEVIRPRNLKSIRTIPLDFFVSGNDTATPESSVWDGEAEAVVFSRIDAGQDPGIDFDEAVIRLFVNRATGLPVTLGFVVKQLSTTYQSLPMAGLVNADVDVTELEGDNVFGFTINRQSTVRGSINALRDAFFFDQVQSDWIMKYPKRGGASVLTIPQQDVGQLRVSDNGGSFIEEVRAQEVELPMRVNVRYRNLRTRYSTDVEHAKRLLKPTPAIGSNNEKTIDLPIVFDRPRPAKRAAEKWLYTTWNERRQLKTVIPWRYIKLDPADVFDLQLFGQTLQLRLIDQDVGLGFAMDITGIQEDAETFDSTTEDGDSLGFIGPIVPSRGITKLILLDAPLLNALDLSAGQVTASYVAMGSYEEGWPGGSAFISADNSNFQSRSLSNSEMAWGTVSVSPGDIVLNDCGDFPNRFQEIVDGGSMIVNVQRRVSSFASVATLDVWNGANAIAIVGRDGVEVLQFETVSIPDVDRPNRLQLDRLLRGRLGTEDIASLNRIHVGAEFVLLAGQPGTNEFGAINKANLEFALVNQLRFWRAVTIGTLLENAPSQAFTYTGRDLKPYSPALVSVVAGTPDGVDVSWDRRTRLNGQWRDGTPDVPLNETIELYEVTVGTIIKQTPSSTINISAAELAQTPDPFQLTLVNGDAETGDTVGWTVETGEFDVRGTSPLPDITFGGSFYFFGGNVGLSRAFQDVAIPLVAAAAVETGGMAAKVDWLQNSGGGDEAEIELEFLDKNGVSLGPRIGSGLLAPVTWDAQTFSLAIPKNAAIIRLSIFMDRFLSPGANEGLTDAIELSIVEASTTDRIVGVQQISGTGLKSPMSSCPFTV